MGPEFLLQFREIMDSIEANDQLEVVVFESAMAYAMMGGLLIATVLTLFFPPALYAMWYSVRDNESQA